jgi:ribosome maturation factor RimP
MKKGYPELQAQLKKLILSMGYELVGCEYPSQGRQIIFRLYIDKPGGVTLDDCSLVSHQVSGMLDVLNPFQARYTLEVSSPGMERPLFEIEHYQQYVGKRVKLRLYAPLGNGRRSLKGVLQSVEDDMIFLLLEDDGQVVKLAYAEIEKANLIADVHF